MTAILRSTFTKVRTVLRVPAVLAFCAIFTAAQDVAVSSPGWRAISPNIQLKLEQLEAGRCTWYFLNTDDQRTLLSMRFKYTVSKVPMTRGPLSNPTSQDGEDELPGSLGPLETIGGPRTFLVLAPCRNLAIRVASVQWSKP